MQIFWNIEKKKKILNVSFKLLILERLGLHWSAAAS